MLKHVFLATTLLMTAGSAAWSQTIVLDPLHGACISGSCADNGTVTPTGSNPLPTFTFDISPPATTAGTDWLIDILIPNNLAGAATESFTIGATNAGPNDTSTIPPTAAHLFSTTAWTSGDLDAYLGISASPTNPIGAWLPYTQGNNCGTAQNMPCDAGATGYYVYQVDLGTDLLQGPSNPTEPVLSLGGALGDTLPAGALITSFIDEAGTEVATANSGAIFADAGVPFAATPEPSSILLLGSMAFFAAALLRKKIHQA